MPICPTSSVSATVDPYTPYTARAGTHPRCRPVSFCIVLRRGGGYSKSVSSLTVPSMSVARTWMPSPSQRTVRALRLSLMMIGKSCTPRRGSRRWKRVLVCRDHKVDTRAVEQRQQDLAPMHVAVPLQHLPHEGLVLRGHTLVDGRYVQQHDAVARTPETRGCAEPRAAMPPAPDGRRRRPQGRHRPRGCRACPRRSRASPRPCRRMCRSRSSGPRACCVCIGCRCGPDVRASRGCPARRQRACAARRDPSRRR